MSQDRDPRTDPRAGDLLSKQRLGRAPFLRLVVIGGSPGFRGVIDVFEGYRGKAATRRGIHMSDWERWAKGAEVLMRGEE